MKLSDLSGRSKGPMVEVLGEDASAGRRTCAAPHTNEQVGEMKARYNDIGGNDFKGDPWSEHQRC